MDKIGIIGGRDSVLGFLAIGFAVRPAADADAARRALQELAAECAAIYITEEYAEALAEDIAKYKDMPTPAVVVLPGVGGSAWRRSAVRRSVRLARTFCSEKIRKERKANG